MTKRIVAYIRLRAISSEQEAVISVCDTGIGISPADQERVFGAFEQVDSTLGRKQQGTGLGLGLCKSLVELHGGCVWLESEVEQGSKFSFSLPLQTVVGE